MEFFIDLCLVGLYDHHGGEDGFALVIASLYTVSVMG